jgi:hypothetical protein
MSVFAPQSLPSETCRPEMSLTNSTSLYLTCFAYWHFYMKYLANIWNICTNIWNISTFCFLKFFIIVVLGVNVTLPKVLKYIIVEFTPPSFYFTSLPHSWNSFNRSNFSIYIHMYIIFLPYLPSYMLSLYPPPSHWYQFPRLDLFCRPSLCFYKIKMTFLFV